MTRPGRYAGDTLPAPYDPGCGRFAAEMTELDTFILDEDEEREVRPEERDRYVRWNDGTYNPKNGHFLCDRCYIAAGTPSNPAGGPPWVCP